MPRKQPPLVVVHWNDAMGQAGWCTPEDLEDATPIPIITAGWLIHETKTHLTIAQSLAGDGDLLGYTIVPKPWVKKLCKLPKAVQPKMHK